jgi:hypothetical protein
MLMPNANGVAVTQPSQHLVIGRCLLSRRSFGAKRIRVNKLAVLRADDVLNKRVVKEAAKLTDKTKGRERDSGDPIPWGDTAEGVGEMCRAQGHGAALSSSWAVVVKAAARAASVALLVGDRKSHRLAKRGHRETRVNGPVRAHCPIHRVHEHRHVAAVIGEEPVAALVRDLRSSRGATSPQRSGYSELRTVMSHVLPLLLEGAAHCRCGAIRVDVRLVGARESRLRIRGRRQPISRVDPATDESYHDECPNGLRSAHECLQSPR